MENQDHNIIDRLQTCLKNMNPRGHRAVIIENTAYE